MQPGVLPQGQGGTGEAAGPEEEPHVHQVRPQVQAEPSVSRGVCSRSCQPAGNAGRNGEEDPVTRVLMAATVFRRL